MNMIHVAGLLGTLVMANAAMAHGGGLNAEGCHTNRKTGDYHCHRGGSRPAPQATAQSLSGDASGTVQYRDCAEARAAGAAPVRRGESGYGEHLDRDGDGVGCE